MLSVEKKTFIFAYVKKVVWCMQRYYIVWKETLYVRIREDSNKTNSHHRIEISQYSQVYYDCALGI